MYVNSLPLEMFVHGSESQCCCRGKLDSLVPEAAISPPGKKASKKADQKRLEISQKIIAKYSKLSGISQLEAKHSYLDYVQEWPLYGATLFIVEVGSFIHTLARTTLLTSYALTATAAEGISKPDHHCGDKRGCFTAGSGNEWDP